MELVSYMYMCMQYTRIYVCTCMYMVGLGLANGCNKYFVVNVLLTVPRNYYLW